MFRRLKTFTRKHRSLFMAVLSFLLSFVLVALCSTSTSFLYPAINSDAINVDSNFFLYEGFLLVRGQTPYVDFYDHKGIYHVLIDALAVLLGGRYALFFIEVLFLAVTLFFLMKTMELYSLPRGATAFALMVYALLLSVMSGGNAEGEFLMPFIAVAQWAYTRGIVKNDRKSFFLGSFFLGFEMGLALNSRPTDIMWGGAIAIYCIVYSARHKKGLDLIYNGLIAVLGLAIPIVSLGAYALVGGFLPEMIDAIYVGGFAYLRKGAADWLSLANRIGLLFAFLLLILSYRLLHKDKALNQDVYEFPFVSLAVAMIAYFAIARYTTYYWTSLTFLSSYLAYFLFTRRWALRKEASRLCLIPASLALLWAIVLTSLYYTSGVLGFSYHESRLIEEAVLAIPEKARAEKGEVYALNCNAAVYIMGDIETDFPYFANQSWWGLSRPEVVSKTNAYLAGEDRPLYLLAGKEEETEKDFGKVIDAYYERVPGQIENPAFVLYIAS